MICSDLFHPARNLVMPKMGLFACQWELLLMFKHPDLYFFHLSYPSKKEVTKKIFEVFEKSLIAAYVDWVSFLICKHLNSMCCCCFSIVGILGALFAYSNDQSEQKSVQVQKYYLLQNSEVICCKHFMYSWMNTCIVYIDLILLADPAFPF